MKMLSYNNALNVSCKPTESVILDAFEEIVLEVYLHGLQLPTTREKKMRRIIFEFSIRNINFTDYRKQRKNGDTFLRDVYVLCLCVRSRARMYAGQLD